MNSIEKNDQVQPFKWELKHSVVIIIFLLAIFLYESYEKNEKLAFRINILEQSNAELSKKNARLIINGKSIIKEQTPLIHNYIQEDGDYYFYEVPHSKKDEKNNRGSYDVLTIKYLGKDKNGYHAIRSYSDDRKPLFTSKCKNPCKVYISLGRTQSVGNSVFSSVTEDVVNGALKPAKAG